MPDTRILLLGDATSYKAVVLAEARRAYTTLSLFGYRVDGVVANRVFPAEDADDWRAGWVMAQDAVLAEVTQSFAGIPLWRSEYGAAEPVGVEALESLDRALYDGADPVASSGVRSPFEVVTVGSNNELSVGTDMTTFVGAARSLTVGASQKNNINGDLS